MNGNLAEEIKPVMFSFPIQLIDSGHAQIQFERAVNPGCGSVREVEVVVPRVGCNDRQICHCIGTCADEIESGLVASAEQAGEKIKFLLTPQQQDTPVWSIPERRGCRHPESGNAFLTCRFVKFVQRREHPLHSRLGDQPALGPVHVHICEGRELIDHFERISIRQFFGDQHLRCIGSDEHCGGNVLINWHLFLLFHLLFFSFLPLYNVARKMNSANEIFHGWMTTLCFELK